MHELDLFLQMHFPKLVLGPSLTDQWEIGIHFPFAKDMYPFNKDGSLNKQMFERVYEQASALFNALFSKQDELFLVTSVYQNKHMKLASGRIKTYDRRVKNKSLLSKLVQRNIPYPFIDEGNADQFVTSQFILKCKARDLRAPLLIQAACNEDFPLLKPRFGTSRCFAAYPDLFFINRTEQLIYFIYDDRGCEIIATDKAILRPIYEKYSLWLDDFDRKHADSLFAN
ncbi:DUF3885 domain-containing protein [Sporolactobacillus shoreicorticis]|uniref:DUF3885 domain-containing protein n=1 Tax=Sporolactobacillus shoreicorticis TaxID=1923877 RepID=A0ABW5S8T5_9BACL|nr:DUF3885 domain-containing protein [Sporolactobacillus shoreicorticis]MCO7125480.1 DUF3885 domain-containing protein [Sporolactobacillus shoreicorticis]